MRRKIKKTDDERLSIEDLVKGIGKTLEHISTQGDYIVHRNQKQLFGYLNAMKEIGLVKKYGRETDGTLWSKYQITKDGEKAYEFLKRRGYFSKK